ncbi:hypothetical protein TMEN_422 [Trichophyton mentagrophytes]|nr:hypothetical protein TMEN_422 [Trichophyton mentagrophytes]
MHNIALFRRELRRSGNWKNAWSFACAVREALKRLLPLKQHRLFVAIAARPFARPSVS